MLHYYFFFIDHTSVQLINMLYNSIRVHNICIDGT